MSNELQTRMVFIDTSAYESKNFQFGQHTLGTLEQLIGEKKLYLLFSDVTINEIKSHLRKHASSSVAAIKKVRKEAMFLRNTPELPGHMIFKDISPEEVFEIVDSKFNNLLAFENVEIISVDIVPPSEVFDAYFNGAPPFDREGKKSEFPDAFVLAAINKISLDRHHSVYIVSSDGDMKSYANSRENLLVLDSIQEIVDLVIRNSEELKEPAVFADSIFEGLKADLIQKAKDIIGAGEFSSDFTENFDDEITDVEISKLDIREKSLVNVTQESATYEVDFDVELIVTYSMSDYDRSPWDPEDRRYVFVLTNQLIAKHTEIYSAEVIFVYDDGLRVNAGIDEFDFSDTLFELNANKAEQLDFRSYDVNGE